MSSTAYHRAPAQSGFTLIEVIVALGVLLVGMTGIFSLFSTALNLQKEATERMDVALTLPAILTEVEEALAARLEGESQQSASALNGAVLEVPGNPIYRYRVQVEPIPDDPDGRGFFCRIEILARSQGEDRVYDMGYRPIIPEPDNDLRIKELIEGQSSR